MANVPNTLTAANSVFTLTIPGLFDAPVQLEGYAADAAFATDSVPMTESVIGVDGQKSSGFVFSLVKQKISIMPTSASMPFFYEWIRAMQAQREDLPCEGTIDLPSIGMSFDCVNGSLSTYPPIPSVKKILQALEFEITWESISPVEV